jgi:O-antigen ligase
LIVVYPSFVVFIGGRFSSLLGNPNGLGIYSFLFFVMVSLIFEFHRNLFSLKEKTIVYGIIIISIVLSGSRGGLFAVLLFLFTSFFFGKSKLLGFVIMASIFIFYQLILLNIEQIATALGLEAFLRIDTLKTGSGRLLAQKFALDQIQKNFWEGKGFGYGEYLMKTNVKSFLSTEHQGNIHNSYLTIWLDTGLVGLIAFCYGWISNFIRAAKHSFLVWALLFGVLLSTSVESWLSASLNPFTIQLIIILSLASQIAFYKENDFA